MFGLTKKTFTRSLSFSRSLTGKVKASNWIKIIFLNSQACMIRSILIELNLHELKHGLRHYPFMVNLDII